MIDLGEAESRHHFPPFPLAAEEDQSAITAFERLRLHPHDLSVVQFDSVTFHPAHWGTEICPAQRELRSLGSTRRKNPE
jgi:hypothetical protein